MSKARVLWALLLLAVAPATLTAQQQGTVQGTVIDASSLQPLSGAHDYEAVRRRILTEIFPAETEKLRIPLQRGAMSDQTVTA